MTNHKDRYDIHPVPTRFKAIVTKLRKITQYLKNAIAIQFVPATSYPVLREAFEVEQSGDETTLIFSSNGYRFVVNSSSIAILGLCNGSRCIRKIITVIANEFSKRPCVVGHHVRKLIRIFVKAKLVDLYSKTTFAPFVALPTSTVIKSEVKTAVRFRMGRFYDQILQLDDALAKAQPRNQVVLRYGRGKLINHNDQKFTGGRARDFINMLNNLNIPRTNFSVIFAGADGADHHQTIPINGHFRATDSDTTILWPLKAYTTIGATIFGRDIDKSDCNWDQKRPKAFWRDTTTGVVIKNKSVDEIDSLIHRPRAVPIPYTGNIIPKANRLLLVDKYWNDEDMNVGLSSMAQIDDMAKSYFREKGFLKQRVSLKELLSYKYQIVVDGNTFASQLPWSLHCQSLVLMVPPAWESIIQGITAWEHYIPLAPDFSDLKAKIEWCRANDRQCRDISRSATELMRRNYNPEQEDMVQQLIIERYVENFSAL